MLVWLAVHLLPPAPSIPELSDAAPSASCCTTRPPWTPWANSSRRPRAAAVGPACGTTSSGSDGVPCIRPLATTGAAQHFYRHAEISIAPVGRNRARQRFGQRCKLVTRGRRWTQRLRCGRGDAEGMDTQNRFASDDRAGVAVAIDTACQAYEMHLAGHSWPVIAEKVGYASARVLSREFRYPQGQDRPSMSRRPN